MSAWDSHEQGRLVYRYGGEPVGAFIQPSIRPLVPSVAHALFLDLTHDNPCPIEKRSVYDLLPSAALVAAACCASGSSRGYDELVPHHIHVVDETRFYAEWSEEPTEDVGFVHNNFGIIAAKRAINKLHFDLGKEGFNQVFVDQVDPDVVAVTRHNPVTHQSVVLISYTAFRQPHPNFKRVGVPPLRVEGVVDEVILEAEFVHKDYRTGGPRYVSPEPKFEQHSSFINGLTDYEVSLREHIPLEESQIAALGDSGDALITQVNLVNLQPGTTIAFRISLQPKVQTAVIALRETVSKISDESNISAAVSVMNLANLNRALYRCDQEEKDEGQGGGVYNIPGFRPLIYCGLQGFESLLSEIRPKNDLGHPMCGNLRQGNWMIDYVWQRLVREQGTEKLGEWLRSSLEPLKEIPRYLVPCYFDAVITGTYLVLLNRVWELMSDFVSKGSSFSKALALGSVQCGAVIHSAQLPQLSPNLAPPRPPVRIDGKGEEIQACVTLSAGLPHFSTGYMRTWGRDTFIALRGLLLLTGRSDEARFHILGYAECLRHGLIPNLLDGGVNARFNCRDAVWWWLYSIQAYVEIAPHGEHIFKDVVSRLFPTDDLPPLPAGQKDQLLEEVIQEALQRHFQGVQFRERNAGTRIDAHMKDEGFNNEIGVDLNTGFVFGGNEFNCGTWMDKMGSSEKAGNKGKPATPRDGSAVELVGLSKGALKFLSKMHGLGHYSYDSVERTARDGTKETWTYDEWGNKIVENFENKFWVNTSPEPENEPRPDLIHRRGIYKDVCGASQPWTDYQLRCNFTIAMVAAPELFNAQHAWTALLNTEKILLGPLGMRTLDPEDWNYNGYYDNSNDGDDLKLAHGFNYHQGPEWLWPVGFFLRAKLHFARLVGGEAEVRRTAAGIRAYLATHFTEIQTSEWRGLPELTNKDGAYCSDSCRTQAWSMGCLLEVLYDMHRLDEKQPIVLSTSEN